jgi:hypothetical protein
MRLGPPWRHGFFRNRPGRGLSYSNRGGAAGTAPDAAIDDWRSMTMDVVAIALAVVAFALLMALIEGIERI